MDLNNQPEPIDDLQKKYDQVSFYGQLSQACPRLLVMPVIIALTVAVFLIMVVIGGVSILEPTVEELLTWGANFAPYTAGGEWWRLFTCMFLHVGIVHLAFNMWVLSDAGQIVERLFGHGLFALIYIGSGLIGSVASAAINPRIVSAGASGAVFGVYGALFGALVRHRDAIPRTVFSRLRNSAVLFVGYNVVYGFTMPQIDNAAHIGGLAGGFLLGIAAARPLDPFARQRSLKGKVLATGTLLVGLLALGSFFLPSRSDARFFQFRRFYAIRADRAAAPFRGRTTMPSPETIETECLPLWKEILTQSENVSISKDAKRHASFQALVRAAELRRQGLTLLMEGLRHNNMQLQERATRLLIQANNTERPVFK
jgi:rhomboid protease GluP